VSPSPALPLPSPVLPNAVCNLPEPKNVVLSNHKRWLHSLQMLKRQLAEEESYMALEEDAKKKRVRGPSSPHP
jgi:hypothetical protein